MNSSSRRGLGERFDPRTLIRTAEDWWFDFTRGVQTSGNTSKPSATDIAGPFRDAYIYAPVRATNARRALGELPIRDFSRYTFVDIGSGKGRVLFLAAEHPFHRVLGVEYSAALHQLALQNIRRYRHRRLRAASIESIHANAAEFDFPTGPLVVYLFNPFGPDTLERMLDNLERSFRAAPRHILLLMLWPEHADVIARRSWLGNRTTTRRYLIFEAAA